MHFLQLLFAVLVISAITGCPSGEQQAKDPADTAQVSDLPLQPADTLPVTVEPVAPAEEASEEKAEKKPAPVSTTTQSSGNTTAKEAEPAPQEPVRGQERPRPTHPYVIISDPVPTKGKNLSMNIRGVRFSGNMIHITFSYGGGCKEHAFELFSTGKKENGVIRLHLVDHQTEDLCKKLLTDTKSFDIKTLKDPGVTELSFKINDYGPVTWSY